jgi:hypothetical protein
LLRALHALAVMHSPGAEQRSFAHKKKAPAEARAAEKVVAAV